MMINAKRGSQWDRCQIRVPIRDRVHWKKEGLKMISTTVIREKRRNQ
jgi:hypothetical protein